MMGAAELKLLENQKFLTMGIARRWNMNSGTRHHKQDECWEEVEDDATDGRQRESVGVDPMRTEQRSQ
jgi:hypothetical protein